MVKAKGYAALDVGTALQPFEFERRDPGPSDVVLELTYCGVCHSDLHFVNNDWKISRYPLVPGHEIVGRVVAVGSDTTKLAVGDIAAIGCIVDSCRTCIRCEEGEEQACEKRATATYNGTERATGLPTYGGYSTSYVVDEAFALNLPAGLDPASSAPLLCAGITTWSPLRHWQIGPGSVVGVVGLGGLGHMGVKFAKAFGAEVVVFTTSLSKVEAARELGAAHVVVSADRAAMKTWTGRLDFVLDTVSAPHDLNSYLSLLKRDGTMCLVGMPEAPAAVSAMTLAGGRRRLTGSSIGGIRETQEMIDFCAAQGISADVEVIGIGDIEKAYERMLRGDVKYRFVVDLATI